MSPTSAALYPGEVRMMASTQLPTGWLACDGGEISRITYAALFQAIGTKWGTAATTTFTLPDFRADGPTSFSARTQGADAPDFNSQQMPPAVTYMIKT